MRRIKISQFFLTMCVLWSVVAIGMLFMVKFWQWPLMNAAPALIGLVILIPMNYILSILFMSLGD